MRSVPTILFAAEMVGTAQMRLCPPYRSPARRGTQQLISMRHQRAAALVERTERFVAGDGGDQLVEVPLALGLLGFLDLEQVHVVHHAAVDADLATLGKE